MAILTADILPVCILLLFDMGPLYTSAYPQRYLVEHEQNIALSCHYDHVRD